MSRIINGKARIAHADSAATTTTPSAAGFSWSGLADSISAVGGMIGSILAGVGAYESGTAASGTGSSSYTLQSEKNSSGLWVGLGVAGILIVGILVYFIVRKKK